MRNMLIATVVHSVPAGAPVFTPDTPLAEEFPELLRSGAEPEGHEKVISKRHPGSFTGTELEDFITSTGRGKVVLVGYMAHVCVSTTARQAAEKGLDVILAEDAIGDRDIPGVKAEELIKTTLLELGDAFGTVVKGSDIK
jgi:nicotinamidase-related amidase